MKRLAALGLLAGLLVAGCGGSTSTTSIDTTPAAATPPQALSTPQQSAPPTASASSAYDRAVAALDRKCEEGPSLIADYITKAQELLQQSGIDESPSSIATHVNSSLPASAPETNCSQVFAAYVTLLQGRGG